jgi:hypothetical protein
MTTLIRCAECKAKNKLPKYSTPFPGCCDACGWAMREWKDGADCERKDALLASVVAVHEEKKERRAPVQGDRSIPKGSDGRESGTIAWSEHEEVWRAYADRGHGGQSAERIAERGGFGYREIVDLIGHVPKTWQPTAKNK